MFDVTPFLLPERSALLDLLGRVGDDEWNGPTECPKWSVKGVALHILGDDLSLLSRQRDNASNGLFLYASEHAGLTFPELLDGFNEQWVRAASFLSNALVVELLELTGRWTDAYYRSVDPTEAGEPVGFFGSQGEPSPWWQVIAREYTERWIHHSQISRGLRLPPLGDALSAPAIESVVLAFGARNPELGRFTIDDRSWQFREGAEVALDADMATTVLSRGLPIQDTINALTGEPAIVELIADQTCLTTWA